ncbi:polysaccharide pyruvyl transferase family protein [Pseudomonas sp. R3.Fl]|uniref:polysaccharide pyruvyl transferase family protein n=1 Tax=Pseudomonas sp. R3.Fl TaxID=2928708 RepID=UPI00201D7E86|nr:polysaccharide pyruvyl transferase family protein [Pseudomonas sp. R3.Fl]MCL6688669.1 polysaccharide pyruvyl transferase family protein [Pseudomonas sp. R3.Fl]
MRRIYTITFQSALNYGATLQAYALAKFLENASFEAKIINYIPSYFFLQRYRPAKGIKKTIEKISKIKRFNKFANAHLPLTAKKYYSRKSLSSINDAHAIICGSDQIWNPDLTGGKSDRAFFLDFPPRSTRKIAFAASTGSRRLPDFIDQVKESLLEFHAMGVREDSLNSDLATLLPEIGSQVVVDPTLLIRDYSEVIDSSIVPKEKYIATYVVGSGPMLAKFDDYVKELKKKTHLPIYHLGSKPIPSADHNLLDIGPSEWLTFIQSADFIATNSFHGTAFSINFEKDFLFFPHLIENLNARQTTLLSRVELMDRLVDSPKALAERDLTPIEYSIVRPRLSKIISDSQDFLLRSIG